MIIQILQIIAAVGTILTGFTGLSPIGGRGITEVRAVLGGLFIALGLFPLIVKSPTAYMMLGVAYLGIGLVRAVSMFADKSVVQSNVISLVVEIIFGIILVVPA